AREALGDDAAERGAAAVVDRHQSRLQAGRKGWPGGPRVRVFSTVRLSGGAADQNGRPKRVPIRAGRGSPASSATRLSSIIWPICAHKSASQTIDEAVSGS